MPKEFRIVTRTKKRGTFSPSLDVLRSSTTFTLQLQRTSPRRKRESRRLGLECKLKLSKFQNNQISYFAFSYSMMCITELCGFAHRRFVSLLLIFFLSNISGANIQLFLLLSASLQKLRRSHHGDVQVGKSFLVAGQYHVGMIRQGGMILHRVFKIE